MKVGRYNFQKVKFQEHLYAHKPMQFFHSRLVSVRLLEILNRQFHFLSPFPFFWKNLLCNSTPQLFSHQKVLLILRKISFIY